MASTKRSAEDQLDLFGSQEPEPQEAIDEPFPANLTLQIPCTWCYSPLASSIGDLRLIQVLVTTPRFQKSLSGPVPDPQCAMCSDRGLMPVRVRRVEGLWWDWGSDAILKADSVDAARRKAGNTEPTPLYVDHGLYDS